MEVIILAGGYGTRISEYTKRIPKPLIKIGKHPILYHIIMIYKKYGFNNFIVALGYKGNLIKKYFKKYKNLKIKFINTGLRTMTGGRLRRLKKYLSPNTNFMLTYGDGVSNVNLKKLLKFHNKNNNLVTVTAVKPPARFGALTLRGNKVIQFREKLDKDSGWINGGFFVMSYNFLKYIKGDNTYLEKSPLQIVAKIKKLAAFKHHGFWQCMDTKRDMDKLNQLATLKKVPWLI